MERTLTSINDFSKKRYRITDRLVCALIVFIPFTIYYNSPIFFSELSTLLMLLLCVLMALKILALDKKILFSNVSIVGLLLIIWIVTTTFISMLSNGMEYDHWNSLISAIVTIIAVFLFRCASIESNLLFNTYKFFAFIAIFGYLFQFIAFFATKNIIILKLPFTINDGYQYSFSLSTKYNNGFVQFSSFFSEKAHFCEYLLPLLCINLFSSKVKRGMIRAILLSVLFLSTASGIGIICVAFLWVCKTFLSLKKKKHALKYALLLSMSLLAVLAVHFVLMEFLPVYSLNVSRLFSSDSGQVSKADYRIYRGFDIYSQLPFLQKIIGIGYRQYSSLGFSNTITSIYDSTTADAEYFSAIPQVLIYFGIIGLIISSTIVFLFWKKIGLVSRMLLAVYLLQCLAASILFDITFLVYFVMIVGFKKWENKYEKQYHFKSN